MTTCFTLNQYRWNFTPSAFNTKLALEGEIDAIESQFHLLVINSLDRQPNYLIEWIDITEDLLLRLRENETEIIGLHGTRSLAQEIFARRVEPFKDLHDLIFGCSMDKQFVIEHDDILHYCIVMETDIKGRDLQLIKNSREFFVLGENKDCFMKPVEPSISYGHCVIKQVAKHCI